VSVSDSDTYWTPDTFFFYCSDIGQEPDIDTSTLIIVIEKNDIIECNDMC